MVFNWNDEMENLGAIGQTYNIMWPIEPAETLKRAIVREEKAGNEQNVKILTRAFESLTKIRNYFMTGE